MVIFSSDQVERQLSKVNPALYGLCLLARVDEKAMAVGV
jgi:hypothetical protein